MLSIIMLIFEDAATWLSWIELKYERTHVLYGKKTRDIDKPIGMKK